MILYILYNAFPTLPTNRDILQLDLINSQITTESFDPGVIGDIANPKAMAVAKISIKGRPNIYEATQLIGRLQDRIKLVADRGIGASTYIYYQPADQRQVYRALILDMMLVPDSPTGEYWADQRHLSGELRIYHEAWEGELTQIPLTNFHGTRTLGAIQIENTTATNYENWVHIDGEDIEGDMPTPVYLEFQNTTVSSPSLYLFQMYIGLNVNSTPSSFVHVIEAEDDATGAAESVDSSYSNGKYTTIAVAGGSNQTQIWSMTAAQNGYANGNLFHVVGAFADGADARFLSYRFHYYYVYPLGLPIWSSQITNLDTSATYKLRELGILRIPPWRVDIKGSSAPLYLGLEYINTTGGALNAKLDALHLFPADGFRFLQFLPNTNITEGEFLIDDQIDDRLYWSSPDTINAQCYTIVAIGGKINLIPQRDQRLYFLRYDQNAAGSSTYIMPAFVLAVRAFYRPRRLTL